MRKQIEPQAGDLGMFVLGAVVGAVTALLLAPESGEDSRHRLSHWLHDRRGAGHEFFVKLRSMLTVRHNGVHAVNGHSSATRKHRRGL